MIGKFVKNERGFTTLEFRDRRPSGPMCTLQESSLATEDAVWFGVAGSDRMHLTSGMLRELIPILQRFVETGRLSAAPAPDGWESLTADEAVGDKVLTSPTCWVIRRADRSILASVDQGDGRYWLCQVFDVRGEQAWVAKVGERVGEDYGWTMEDEDRAPAIDRVMEAIRLADGSFDLGVARWLTTGS